VTLKNLGQALCLALLVSASAAAGSLPPLGVLREQAKLTGVGDAVGDRYERFGISLAADGDTVIVGAPGKPFPEEDEGAAYVFVRT
jgi:FG-GAP repeat